MAIGHMTLLCAYNPFFELDAHNDCEQYKELLQLFFFVLFLKYMLQLLLMTFL